MVVALKGKPAKGKEVAGMSYGTGRLWKAAGALLLALTVSLGTLGAAQANHKLTITKVGWYDVGGSDADRMLAKDAGIVATWTHVRLDKDYSWRAYWTIKNTSGSPKEVGCAGYQNYGLKGFKAKVKYHGKTAFERSATDAKCVHLGGDYRQTLRPGETITSWADFKYSGKTGTCTMITLPTGPNVPEHVPYTACVDPYAGYLGDSIERNGYRLPFVVESKISQGPECGKTHGSNPARYGYAKSKEAIDFAMPEGTNVYAAKAGEIVMADLATGAYEGFGNLILIKHDDGNVSFYAHLDEFKKRRGHVDQGDLIATSGTTGMSDAPHLHFEVRDKSDNPVSIRHLPGITWYNGNPSDPCRWGEQYDGVAYGPPVN
jgi:murein DD-endopeptidase MepM/ murein hydrolase activator NlpD